MPRWYVQDRRGPRGPYTIPEIARQLEERTLEPTAQACQEGDTVWQPLYDLVPLRRYLGDERAAPRPARAQVAQPFAQPMATRPAKKSHTALIGFLMLTLAVVLFAIWTVVLDRASEQDRWKKGKQNVSATEAGASGVVAETRTTAASVPDPVPEVNSAPAPAPAPRPKPAVVKPKPKPKAPPPKPKLEEETRGIAALKRGEALEGRRDYAGAIQAYEEASKLLRSLESFTTGGDKIYARRKRRVAEKRIEVLEGKVKPAEPTQSAPAPTPAPKARPQKPTSAPKKERPRSKRYLRCCDGTRSRSCKCDRASNSGCCSKHDGVCGCAD